MHPTPSPAFPDKDTAQEKLATQLREGRIMLSARSSSASPCLAIHNY